jgi:hypothetical protein
MATNSQTNPQQHRLPGVFQPLFWSYRFEDLDPRRDEKTIIVQLINYGSLTQWRWLVRQYGASEIRRILQSIPETEIKPRSQALASLLFSIPTWKHAHRGAH